MADTNGSLNQTYQQNPSMQSLFQALDPISLILSQNSADSDHPVPLRLTTESYIMERGPRYGAYADLRETKLRMKMLRQQEYEENDIRQTPPKKQVKFLENLRQQQCEENDFKRTPPKKQVKFQENLGNSRKGLSVLAQSVPDFSATLRKENRKPRQELTPPSKNVLKMNNGLLSNSRGSKSANAGEKRNGGLLMARKSYASVEELKGLSLAANRPAFEVHLVQVYPSWNGNFNDPVHSDPTMKEDAQSSYFTNKQGMLPPPTFGSSPHLEAFQAFRYNVEDGDGAINSTPCRSRPMHEITFSTVDRPKLLSQLTSLLAEIGLNIQEAHAFSTVDGFSLDVFVVDGWLCEETEELKNALEKEILKAKDQCFPNQLSVSLVGEQNKTGVKSLLDNVQIPSDGTLLDNVQIPSDGTDVWEIHTSQLKVENKVASGSYGDLYRGIYCSQEVAIKVLKPERVSAEMLREFSQEVYIMRKVRHKNVVQLIGACTRSPNLCIVTEFMAKGSLYNFLHKQKGVFKLPSLIKVAIDVSKGMNYLHQNNIIHRDLKTANLLMDENEVVKVADFGVARVQTQSGVMTAETGTYRWMAPEVIEHKPYDYKADVFSFGIVMWELLTGELPYSYLTPLQAAVGVVQKGLRPTIPKHTYPKLAELLERCWQRDPTQRPNFSQIIDILQQIAKEVGDEREDGRRINHPMAFSQN